MNPKLPLQSQHLQPKYHNNVSKDMLTTPVESILPDEPLLLMGAGPVPVPPKVAAANSLIINHVGDTMSVVIDRVKRMARYVFQTTSSHIFGVSGPASAAMEMAVTSVVWPGRKVLVIKNGLFSARLEDMARRLDADCFVIDHPAGVSVNADQVIAEMDKNHYDVITIVQGETSCTVYNSELETICKAAKERGVISIVDAVCTLSTMPLEMDDWAVDIIITGGQKGLSAIPGVSLIAFSEDVFEAIRSRPSPPPHWCLDVHLAEKFWEHHGYHYTAPVSGILALHEALRLICLETLEARHFRHKICSRALQAGLEAMGFELFVAPEHRLDSVIGIKIPGDLSGKDIMKVMTNNYRVEISGSFGLPIIRVGQMGEQARSHNLFRTIHALGMACQFLGVSLDVPQGMAVLEKNLADLVQLVKQGDTTAG